MTRRDVIAGNAGSAAPAANDASQPSARAAARGRYPGARADGTGLPPVHHVGLVVKDCERALAKLSYAMGFGAAYRFEGNFADAVLANGDKGLHLRGAFVWMNNTALEIVEPVDDRSPHHEFLADHGEGLHHLAFWVDSVAGEIAAMRAGGADARILVDGTGPGNEVPWCYVEGDMMGAAIIELIERNEGSEQFYAEVFKAIGGTIPV
ncbi:VOC family protein [Novosphingobium sp. PS1R-30]|uniref:VOC family protein n=1 Tax=Novosphingobium anseongense TaxID=3133436 RepID=A0ABU8S0J8_9SPHN